MRIERMQVDEGFLDGLDIEFSSGLNVLVGPRGAGKTSVIELLRFCLGAPTVTDLAAERARRHALSVLASGRVTATVADGDLRFTVSRTAADSRPITDDTLPVVSILAQNEIELIGLQDRGRLRLIDAFLAPEALAAAEERHALAQLKSMTSEIRALYREIDQVDEQLQSLRDVPKQLAAARDEEARVLSTTSASAADQARLASLQTAIGSLSVKSVLVTRSRAQLAEWGERFAEVHRRLPGIGAWPPDAGEVDLLEHARASVPEIDRSLMRAETRLNQAVEQLTDTLRKIDVDRQATDEEARSIRIRIERIQAGAGAVTRRVQAIQEQAGQLSALRAVRAARRERLAALKDERGAVFERLDRIRTRRYSARRQVATSLNKRLGPRIRVDVQRAAIDRAYVEALTEGLRGSGLHYNTLAPLLAQTMSPREITEAVENSELRSFVAGTQLSQDRATRALAHFREHGVEDIATVAIDDGVRLSLLDGADYKPTPRLSTGQRCTVVLPIVLSHRKRPVIVDQPEDHLDNAFIADTVIKALAARDPGDQFILSTHNANIPVLGEADLVVVMGSDGKRGFTRHAAPLDDPRSVEAITTVMEGGRDAFEYRAAYYRRNR